MGRFLDSLSQDEPLRLAVGVTAAVSVILRKRMGEVLMIKRAERSGDPWSGQVAFPGGRVSAEDGSFRETAERETQEEVGIRLEESARFLGYMESVRAKTRDIRVAPCVFELTGRVRQRLGDEVASTFWLPLTAAVAAEKRSSYVLRRGGRRISFPSIVYEGQEIWGLTERILSMIVGGGARDDLDLVGRIERY